MYWQLKNYNYHVQTITTVLLKYLKIKTKSIQENVTRLFTKSNGFVDAKIQMLFCGVHIFWRKHNLDKGLYKGFQTTCKQIKKTIPKVMLIMN